MDLEITVLSEINQSEIYDLTSMWNLMNKMNRRENQRHGHMNRRTAVRGRGRGLDDRR